MPSNPLLKYALFVTTSCKFFLRTSHPTLPDLGTDRGKITGFVLEYTLKRDGKGSGWGSLTVTIEDLLQSGCQLSFLGVRRHLETAACNCDSSGLTGSSELPSAVKYLASCDRHARAMIEAW